jgi:hypothetical protein
MRDLEDVVEAISRVVSQFLSDTVTCNNVSSRDGITGESGGRRSGLTRTFGMSRSLGAGSTRVNLCGYVEGAMGWSQMDQCRRTLGDGVVIVPGDSGLESMHACLLAGGVIVRSPKREVGSTFKMAVCLQLGIARKLALELMNIAERNRSRSC